MILVQATPGPDMLLVIARGVAQGRRVALATAFGATLVAGVIQLPMLAFGVTSLIRGVPMALVLLRWAGGAYLAWLGVGILRRASQRLVTTAVPNTSVGWAILNGAISNLTNPKVLLFMLAIIPQFVVPQRGPVASQLLALGLIQKLSGFTIMSVVAMVSGNLGYRSAQHRRAFVCQRLLAGTVLVGLGIAVAFGAL